MAHLAPGGSDAAAATDELFDVAGVSRAEARQSGVGAVVGDPARIREPHAPVWRSSGLTVRPEAEPAVRRERLSVPGRSQRWLICKTYLKPE
jgi:hypothetical protein